MSSWLPAHFPALGLTEPVVLEVIEAAVLPLARTMKFAYLEADDLAQEGRIEALACLPKFDHTKNPKLTSMRDKLAAFVFQHVKRRLLNRKRDLFRRADAPCPQCQAQAPHEETRACRLYVRWAETQNSKAALAGSAAGIGQAEKDYDTTALQESREDSPKHNAEVKEILAILDRELTCEERADWLQMRAGVSLSPQRRRSVKCRIMDILLAHGVEVHLSADERSDVERHLAKKKARATDTLLDRLINNRLTPKDFTTHARSLGIDIDLIEGLIAP